MIQFFVGNIRTFQGNKKNLVHLIHDSWDDWFAFSTLYNVRFYDHQGVNHHLGSVKIGQKGMRQDQRIPDLPTEFSELIDVFFSVGQDVSYYEKLNTFNEDIRVNILESLNDICFNQYLYRIALKERVTKVSLMRSVSKTSIEGQFRRLAQGSAVLTPYRFIFIAPKNPDSILDNMHLEFNVIPNSNPPTNIHVIIGRNGVGKTYLFNNMIISLLNGNKKNSACGYFLNEDEKNKDLFANLISVSFSAFDDTNPVKEKEDKVKYLNYTYIGLKQIEKDKSKLPPKSPGDLREEFVKSVEQCFLNSKIERWFRALKMLEADPIFKESEISQVAKVRTSTIKDKASIIFSKLSSGHKIILLTITKLVETVEERSLVIIDEPEIYLHPPLLSAFTRALSDLLINRNAVGIIGTHSPVILQEVPNICVWKLRRKGANAICERLDIESFGENVGLLTQEVFGLEVTDSGFHKILRDLVDENESYEDAMEVLENQLGNEGKAILRNLFLIKNEKS